MWRSFVCYDRYGVYPKKSVQGRPLARLAISEDVPTETCSIHQADIQLHINRSRLPIFCGIISHRYLFVRALVTLKLYKNPFYQLNSVL